MYHPDIIARRQEAVLKLPVGKTFPQSLLALKTDDNRALSDQIQSAYDPEKQGYVRRLTLEEEGFIAMSQIRVQYDAPFYLDTFVMIDEEGHGLRPLFPLWESQQFTLNRLATLEKKHEEEGHPDGLLANVLKARQLGISTLAEAIVSHRIFCHPHIRAVAGSDVEEQAVYLFKMVERIYAHLPIFLRPPKIVPYKAGKELNLDNKSRLTASWGKSTRGALQEAGGKKGNIERGRTNSVVHISELATWDNPEQLDSALIPGIPVSPVSLCLFESTAEIAGDWWHRHWLACEEGATPRDWANIFIPWCVEPTKYALPAPYAWSPSDATVKVAQTIERDAFRWVGKTLHLNRDQLFWYETTRAYYQKKNQLHQFLKEYPSNPEECIAGDVRISTERGLIPIVEAADVVRVETGDVAAWWDRGVRQTFKVRTQYGREFSATAEHLVALTDGTWRAVRDLQAQDEIVLSSPAFAVHDYFRARWNWTPGCSMETVVDEDLARLIGFFIGDGSWVDHGLSVACCAKDDDVVSEVARLLERTIGRSPISRRRGGCVDVRSSNRRWWQLWWHLGLLNKRDDGSYYKRLRVPECIWRSPRPVIAAFISGLFESDGFTADKYAYTSLFSKSEDLIRDVQLLLLGFGINAAYQTCCKTTKGKKYTGRYLKLNKYNTEIFHRDIGFVGRRKRGRAERPQAGQGGRHAIPLHMTDRIEAVVPDCLQPVYDIGVHDTHRFGANGVLVHNCFQYAGRSVLSPEQIEVIDQAAKKILDVWAVEPSREIAELKRLPDDPRAQALKEDPRPPAPIAPKMGREADLHPVPAGYGFRRISKAELEALPSLRHSVMTIFEYPRVRGRRRYVVGVDVGDGLGLDYSVVSVIREPTIEEPAEEVAQYVSNRLKPSQLASVVDAIGRFYSDEDGIEALAAIELNNHGASVQDLLQLHLGYSNFYVWEVVDAADPSIRQTKRIGWITSSRTRPLLIEKFIDAITTIDPISLVPDFRLNSPVTRAELRFFVTEGLLGEAEHAKSQHDDAIFGSAIGYYVAHRLAGGETEPIAERRRRRDSLKLQAQLTGRRVDYRNSAMTADEQDQGVEDALDEFADTDSSYFH